MKCGSLYQVNGIYRQTSNLSHLIFSLDHIQLSVHEYREKLYEIISTRKINVRRIQYNKLMTADSVDSNNASYKHQNNGHLNGGGWKEPNGVEGNQGHIQPNNVHHNQSTQPHQQRPLTSQPTVNIQKQQIHSTQDNRPKTGFVQDTRVEEEKKKKQHKEKKNLEKNGNGLAWIGQGQQLNKQTRYKQEFGSTTSFGGRKEGHIGRYKSF
jgi:hypothetical protein